MSQYKEFICTFIINNFSFFKNSCNIYSSNFIAENIDDFQWRIIVSYYDQIVRLGLERTNLFPMHEKVIDFQMVLCNAENKVLYTSEKKEKAPFCIFADSSFLNDLQADELEREILNTSEDTLIVKCWMGGASERVGDSLSESCTVKTTRGMDELSYMRTVSYYEHPGWTSKLSFPINELEQIDIIIENNADDILFKMHYQNDVKKKFLFRKMKCKTTLLDCEGKEKMSCCYSINFSSKNEVWNYPTFLKRSSLEKKTHFLDLKFTIAFANGLILKENIDEKVLQNKTSSMKVSKSIPDSGSLKSDLRKMLFSKDLSDVSFCVNSENISAHKLILASRSPVFSTMFQQNMVENQTGVINITDMDVQTLKLFLEFLYTGVLLETDCDRVLELLLAAEKYQVQTLKEDCCQYLKNHLSPDSVCDTLSVADMVGDQTLKNAIKDYIKENVKTVLSSSKWFKFIDKNPKLCSEIFCDFSENLKS